MPLIVGWKSSSGDHDLQPVLGRDELAEGLQAWARRFNVQPPG